MAVAFLDFEQPIAELEAKIEELRHVTSESEVNIKDEISRLQAKSRQLTRNIFANLTPWQITQLARHPQRGGQCAVMLRYRGSGASGTLGCGVEWKVRPTAELLEQLAELLGPGAARLSYVMATPAAELGSASCRDSV